MKAAVLLGLETRRMADASIPDPGRDARRLLAHIMGIPSDRLTLHVTDELSAQQIADFKLAIAQRLAGRPVSQITGKRAFWGRDFVVTDAVLDPRPETECLVDEALKTPFARVLDLGTGSGAIVLSLLAERPRAKGVGVDISPEALAVARENAQTLSVADRVTLSVSNWFTDVDGRFDLIVSNPPYISDAEYASLDPGVRDFEPACALSPGGDGLAAYRAIVADASRYLEPGGRLLFEIGPTQAEAVSGFLERAGFMQIRILPDLDGRDRIVAATRCDEKA